MRSLQTGTLKQTMASKQNPLGFKPILDSPSMKPQQHTASKDLEAYLQLRTSQESVNQGHLYNFKDLDDQFSCKLRQSNSPPQRLEAERDKANRRSPAKKSIERIAVKAKPQPSSLYQSSATTRQNVHKQLKMTTQSVQESRSKSNGARLQELCPEDKAKIGELVRKLAEETKQKQEVALKYEQEKEQLASRMRQLELQSSQYEQEKDKFKGKLTESVRLLQHMKELKQQAEDEKNHQLKELQKIKEEVAAREKVEKERQKQQKIAAKEQQEQARLLAQQESSIIPERQLPKDKSNTSSVLNLQDFLQNSPQTRADDQTNQLVVTTSNTLKEISELKSEIIKLTQSLRVLKGPDHDSPQEQVFKNSCLNQREKRQFNNKDIYVPNVSLKEQEVEDSLAADKSMENKWWKLHHQTSDNENSPPRPQKQQPPQPEQIRDRDQLLNEKIQMFKEIKSRFTANQSTVSLKQSNQSKNQKDSFYEEIVQKQTQQLKKIQNQVQSPQLIQTLQFTDENINHLNLLPRPSPPAQMVDIHTDSDDDLVYSLNQKSSLRVYDNHVTISQAHNTQTSERNSLGQSLFRASQLTQKHYDQSLLNIIDEIENDQQVTYNTKEEFIKIQQTNDKLESNRFQSNQSYDLRQSQYRHQNHQYSSQIELISPQIPHKSQSDFIKLDNGSSYKNNPFYLQAKI